MTGSLLRIDHGHLLGTRAQAAGWTGRHPDLVRRRVQPVACDIATRWPLYDLDQVARFFRDTPRRAAA